MSDIKTKILDCISKSEYKDCVLKERIYGCHGDGLPPYEVVMSTEGQVAGGGMTHVFVTPTEVYKAFINYPLNFNSWRVVTRSSYNSPEELIVALSKHIKKPTGCWE
jgi:hypothetical protein